jgi:hypothetical protein
MALFYALKAQRTVHFADATTPSWNWRSRGSSCNLHYTDTVATMNRIEADFNSSSYASGSS